MRGERACAWRRTSGRTRHRGHRGGGNFGLHRIRVRGPGPSATTSQSCPASRGSRAALLIRLQAEAPHAWPARVQTSTLTLSTSTDTRTTATTGPPPIAGGWTRFAAAACLPVTTTTSRGVPFGCEFSLPVCPGWALPPSICPGDPWVRVPSIVRYKGGAKGERRPERRRASSFPPSLLPAIRADGPEPFTA